MLFISVLPFFVPHGKLSVSSSGCFLFVLFLCDKIVRQKVASEKVYQQQLVDGEQLL